MSEKPPICETHALPSSAAVCRHIAAGTATALFRGDPSPRQPPADAWCETCESIYQARAAIWDDVAEAAVGFRFVCSDCYERLTRHLPDGIDRVPDEYPFEYRCGSCDLVHRGLPTWGADVPIAWLMATEEERSFGEINADLCTVHGDYFIRGLLEIPIIGSTHRMVWGVWTSLSEESFRIVNDRWEAPDRAGDEPRFGWLCTQLPIPAYEWEYPLKSLVYTQPPGVRPRIVLEATDHPLAVDQRTGITRERAESMCESLLAAQGGGRRGVRP